MKISRATKFLPDPGAEVSITLTGTHYRRSPLVQKGLEIQCNLTASLPGYSTRNHVLLQKYFEIVSDLYVEPTKEEIIGSFLIPNEVSSRTNQTNSKQPSPSKKKKTCSCSAKTTTGA